MASRLSPTKERADRIVMNDASLSFLSQYLRQKYYPAALTGVRLRLNDRCHRGDWGQAREERLSGEIPA